MKLLVNLLPPQGKILLILFAEAIKKRRWPKGVSFGYSHDLDMYFTSFERVCGAEGRLYFYNPFRLGRYFNRGGESAFDWMETKYHLNDIKIKEPVCVEIGANIGEFSLAFKRRFSDGELYAFEPDPVAFRCLKENLRNEPGCSVFETAIALEVGAAQFYLSPLGADSSFIPPETIDGQIEVDAWTLDHFLDVAKLTSVDFLKIEAEGYEPEILLGGSKFLQITNFIVIDCGPERLGRSTIQECSEILRNVGFDCHIDGWQLVGIKI